MACEINPLLYHSADAAAFYLRYAEINHMKE